MSSWSTNIKLIGLYEIRMIKRSNLFKVFIISSLFGITLFQILIQSNLWPWYDWTLCAIPSAFPYLATYLYSIIQCITLIILISDFSDKSRNLSNAEGIFYTRPISNVEYIVGKVYGIIFLYITVNVIVLIVTLSINIFASETPVNISYYLFYLITMSIPSLIFIIGLTLFISIIIPYRSLALFILFIYYFFALKEPEICNGIFDFQSFSLHNIFSDITGHPNIGIYILHRAIYLFMGIGFIFLSVCYFYRLPNNKSLRPRYALLCFSFFIFALGMVFAYENSYIKRARIRNIYVQEYKNYCNIRSPKIIAHNLQYCQNDKIINVQSKMKLQNNSLTDTLDDITLYLNPGLKVKTVTSNNIKLDFTQRHQVFCIKKKILPNEIINLNVEYEGKINSDICHILVDNATYFNTYTDNGLLHLGKNYCFVNKTYTLLTPESLWYPTSSEANPFSNIKNNYCDYSLNVKINNLGKDKLVISQGTQKICDNNTISFKNENKLSGLSLCIGKYIEKKIKIDSVIYSLYFFPGHGSFVDDLSLALDSLASILPDFVNSYQMFMQMPFLWHQIKLVETPISFASYTSNVEIGSSFVQPEIFFLPEKGTTLPKVNFKQGNYQLKKIYSQRRAVVDERDIQIQNLYQFLIYNFTLEKVYQRKGNIFADIFTFSSSMEAVTNKYYMDPIFQRHVLSVYSRNIAESNFIFNLITKPDYDLKKYLGNLYTEEIKYEAIHCLSTQSLRDILRNDSLVPELKSEILKLKSKFMRNYILSSISELDFKEFVSNFMLRHKFEIIPLKTFLKELNDSLHLDIFSTFNDWYNVNQIPKFKISNLKTYLVKGDTLNYIVNIKVLNTSNTTGLLSFKLSDRALNKQIKHFVIPAQECKEINLFSVFFPQEVEINTNISKNYPLISRYAIYSVESISKYSGKEGISDCSDNYFASNFNEIIIDNESEMFHVHKNLVDNFFKSTDDVLKNKYKTFMYWAPPRKWLMSINNTFYGDFVKSAYYIRSGEGRNSVDWCIPIAKAGKFEIYVYKGLNNIINRHSSSKQYYTIISNGVAKEVELDFVKDSKDGWFFLDSVEVLDELKIVLTDKGDKNKIIIADAIKLIRVN